MDRFKETMIFFTYDFSTIRFHLDSVENRDLDFEKSFAF